MNGDRPARQSASSWARSRLSIEGGRTPIVDVIETHMSRVLLTRTRAYKLKKPIRTAFLDYTTLGARRRACDTEVRLNRRLAPGVYRGVLPVVSVDGRACVGGAGDPIDWAVEMRRLPDTRMLDTCIAEGRVRTADVVRLAAALIRFYAGAEPVPAQPADYRSRFQSDIADKCSSLAGERYGLDPATIDRAAAALRGWLERHASSLEARARAVIDAHGDLRPEHICLEAPTPVAIDALEFSRDLRLLDPLSELSFLALECDRLGAPWIGNHLLDAYVHHARVADSRVLVGFYQGYHALVRAAVAVWHLDDEQVPRSPRWQERARWYLSTARDRASRVPATR